MKRFADAIRRGSLLVALLSLPVGSIAQAAPAAETIQAAPAGPWSLDYGGWQCALKRNLTSGRKDGAFSLSLEPLTSTAWMRIALPGGGASSSGDDAIMFVDGQRLPGTLHYNASTAGQYRVREYMLDLKKQDLGAVRDHLRFSTAKDGDVDMQLDAFPAAWAALNKCMADFYRDLGVGAADQVAPATPAQAEATKFIDLPTDSLPLDFAMFFWISTDGRAEKCRLLKPSGNQKFDQSLCREVEAKARFKPAMNASGVPIRVPHFEHDSIFKTVEPH